MKGAQLRVLHILAQASIVVGGPPVAVVNLANALEPLGVSVPVAATAALSGHPRNPERVQLPRGASELELNVFPVHWSEKLAFSPELTRYLSTAIPEADVVHIHSLFQYPQYTAYRLCRKYNVPYIVSPRGALDPHLRPRGKVRKRLVDILWQRAMLDNAAALHYTSTEEARLVEDLDFGSPAVVIPNCIRKVPVASGPDAEAIERIRMELGLTSGPIIGNHGRLNHKKGIPVLIDAMTRVIAQVPEAKLVLVGPDSLGLQRQLQQRVQQLGIETSVVFAGLRTGAELDAVLSLFDVWALPSYSENFGNAVVEAMARGLPIVTTAQVNIAPEAAEEGALHLARQTPEAFAESILLLLGDRVHAAELGRRGREYVKRYDSGVVAPQYLDLYRRVSEGRSPT